MPKTNMQIFSFRFLQSSFGSSCKYSIQEIYGFVNTSMRKASLFTTIWGALGTVLTTVDLCKVAFFGGAVNDTLSSGMSSSLDEYLQCFIYKKENRHSFSKAFGWIAWAFDLVTTIVEGMNVFTPSLADVVVYDKINRNSDYRVTLTSGQNKMTIKELYDYCDF